MALTVLTITFMLLLVLGVPVAFTIALSSIAALMAFDPDLGATVHIGVAFQRMVSGMNIFSFLAIPFFIFSGDLMLYSGIAEKIVNFAKALVGHVKGGLGMANVVACTMFGGVSGSPVADVSAMGAVMIPMMKKEGYSADYAVNVTTHAALVGALMPTSHNMIIYAFAAQNYRVSPENLMFAGLVPALVLSACMLIAAYFVARKHNFPIDSQGRSLVSKFAGWPTIALTFLGAVPGLMVVAVILVFILGGVGTATEGAGVAVTYSLFLCFIFYPLLNWISRRVKPTEGSFSQIFFNVVAIKNPMSYTKLMTAAGKAVKTTGVVLLLIGVSTILQHVMALTELPDRTGELLKSMTSNPLVMLFLINVLLFLLGTFMDMAATILICTPIFLPLAVDVGGIGPVQFGMMILINCALGLNTPPVGTTQFVGCAIGEISVGQVMKTIIPFYAALTAALLAVTYIPSFSTWLPTQVKQHQVAVRLAPGETMPVVPPVR